MDLFGQSACNNNNNPLHQNLILRLVLEHVGKANVTDLKNCRLVNHSWNRVAVQVLEEQHGYALALDLKNMDAFENVLWRTQLSRIRSEQRPEMASLRLSIKLRSRINNISEQETVKSISCAFELRKAGRMLQLNSQLRVAFIDYTIDGIDVETKRQWQMNFVNQELFNILTLTSATLKRIDFSCINVVGRHFEEFDFNSLLTFPSLTYLVYKINNPANKNVGEEEMLDLTKHVVSIIQGAPKLTKLKLCLWDGDVERTTNSLHSIMKCCADRLDELEFEISVELNELDAFEALSEIKFPALRILIIINGFYSANKWLNLFLKNNCPALVTLEVEWTFTFTEERNEEEQEPMLLDFPSLPNILAFSLDVIYNSSPDYLEHVHASFSTLMKGLPSLKSCYLGLNLLFMLGAHLKASGHLVPPPTLYPVFPNISTLEIIVDDDVDDDDDENFDLFNMTTVVYQHTFPNLRKLAIRTTFYFSRSEQGAGRVGLEIEFLCRHPGIQILEVQDYSEPWLDHFSIPSPSLEGDFPPLGLKTLKILAPETVRGARLDPVQIVKRFPALEFLQFGKHMLSATQIQTFRDMLKIFEDPVSNY